MGRFAWSARNAVFPAAPSAGKPDYFVLLCENIFIWSFPRRESNRFRVKPEITNSIELMVHIEIEKETEVTTL